MRQRDTLNQNVCAVDGGYGLGQKHLIGTQSVISALVQGLSTNYLLNVQTVFLILPEYFAVSGRAYDFAFARHRDVPLTVGIDERPKTIYFDAFVAREHGWLVVGNQSAKVQAAAFL